MSDTIKVLTEAVRGRVVTPSDSDYDEARAVYNAMHDRKPRAVIQCVDAADVMAAVRAARDGSLDLAIRGGGHSVPGFGTVDGGLVIDLSPMKSVWVDPVKKIARVGGGATLGDVDHATYPFGLAAPGGIISTTGVGGLTLGGGIGYLTRSVGLTIDNLLSADVVLADGRQVTASDYQNEDLFWALRGGGGNFGVVTSFEFNLHPMQRQVVAGDIAFPIDRARELLEFYAEYSVDAPPELYVDAILATPPGGKPGVFLLSTCYSGPAADAERVLAPIRKLGKPLSDSIGPMDYVAVQRMHDNADPRNIGTYLKSGFIGGFRSGLIDAMVEGYVPHPERATMLFFQNGGGAIGKVAVDATAFPHRYATHNVLTLVSWPLELDRTPHVEYLRGAWSRLEPFTHGYYTNEVADEAQAVVDENYQGNLARMREVKRKYDPINLFRLNANVQPA